MSKRSVHLLLCVCLTVVAHGQQNESTADLQGSLVEGNVYFNPALGMRISLAELSQTHNLTAADRYVEIQKST